MATSILSDTCEEKISVFCVWRWWRSKVSNRGNLRY